VRALSEAKVWSMLGRLKHHRQARRDDAPWPRRLVGVLGCMAEREAKALAQKTDQVDLLCGPSELHLLPQLIEAARHERGLQSAISGHVQRRSSTRERAGAAAREALDLGRSAGEGLAAGTQAYVRITRGCNKFCAFCVVPYTRGPEAHRPADHVVDEVRRLCASGVREVTLLGQTINHYRHQQGDRVTDFAELLARVHDEVPELARLRFLTSYPRDFSDAALDVMASRARICPYLHVPGQSGSNRILKKMNRGYTVEQYVDFIDRARARMPDVRLAGDMIVGYPTETEEDHEASLALLRRVRLKTCYVFKYSPRSGTVAARRLEDDVPVASKRRRNAEMLAVQRELSLSEHQRQIGQVLEVLVDKEGDERPWAAEATAPGLVSLGRRPKAHGGPVRRLIGRSRGDEIVAFDGPPSLIGQLVPVAIEQATATVLYGRPVGA
jgi:tRNA-2-methylthio-N6-dimethylallyladenosine synthase